MKRAGLAFGLSKAWQMHAAGVGLCLVMSATAYLVGVVPLTRRAAAAQTQTLELDQERQKVDKLTKSRQRLDGQLDRARRAVEEGSFQLRPVEDLNKYLAQLTKLATGSGLTLHEIQPGQTTDQTHYQSVPIVMSGTGSYRTCMLFLHKLHSELLDTRLSSLTLSASDRSRKPGAKFRLALVWHAASDPKKSGN